MSGRYRWVQELGLHISHGRKHLTKVRRKANEPSIEEIAREKFGYKNLRPGQSEAIRAVLRGRDTLVVMPTGAGKSAIYQIPIAKTGGTAIVVSPLIALQQDQVESITAREIS